MALPRRYTDKLARIGMEAREYRESDLTNGRSGYIIRHHGKQIATIYHTPTGWGGDGKWRLYVVDQNAVIGLPKRTVREALAELLIYHYKFTDRELAGRRRSL